MRTTIVSTSKLKTYRIWSLIIVIGLLTSIIGFTLFRIIYQNIFFEGLSTIVWIIIFYRAIHVILKIKSVSYDGSSVYYDKRGFEVQIPFEDIKGIEIKTISGIYKINLFAPSQDGPSIMFKTSLWYPFNFKKQDEKVNELRDRIDRYKRTLTEKNFAGLTSYNI